MYKCIRIRIKNIQKYSKILVFYAFFQVEVPMYLTIPTAIATTHSYKFFRSRLVLQFTALVVSPPQAPRVTKGSWLQTGSNMIA